jgi:hypothetical protein
MVFPQGPDLIISMPLEKEIQGVVTILVRFTPKIQPEENQYIFIWETKNFFMRRSLRPGQTVSPTPISGSANLPRPVALSSGTVSLDEVVQGS